MVTDLDYSQVIQNVYDEPGNRLRVDATFTGTLEVHLDPDDDGVRVYGTDGITDIQLKTNSSGELQVGVVSSALPSGAATAARQDTGNASLASIDSKLGTLGQKAMAGSAPVVIASDQSAIPVTGTFVFTTPQHVILDSGTLTTITNPVTVVNSGTFAVQAAQSGTWNINNISGTISLPTGASTSANQTTANSSLSSIDGKLNSLGQKVMAGSVPVVIASDQSSVPVTATISGSVTVSNLPTTVDTNYGVVGSSTLRTAAQIGNATGAAAFNAGTTSAQTLRVVLPTDQTAIPATQSGTWNINNISGTISLPTGASTSANQTTANSSLSSIDSKLGTLGQKNMAGSAPVVIASDQSTLPVSLSGNQAVNVAQINGITPLMGNGVTGTGSLRVTIASDNTAFSVNAVQSGTWNINNISGTVSLPTGASTSALQTTGNTSLSSIDGKFGSLGQKTMAGSAPVVIASDQSAIAITVASLPLPSGAATEATLAKLPVAQGSTTSGQSGSLMQGAVTTAAPSYTTAQTSPLSLDTSGNLRVAGTVTVTPSGTQNVNVTQIGGTSVVTGNGVTGAGSQRVTIASDNTAISVKMQDGSGNALTSSLVNSKQSLDIRTNEGFATGSNTRVAIQTTPTTTILAANANRRYAFIQNNSGSLVYLKFGAAAVVGQGIRLPASALFEINTTNLWTGSVDAIGAGVTLDIFEGTT